MKALEATIHVPKGARRPDAAPVGLMNGDQLVSVLVENRIYITRTPHYIIRVGEEEPDA